MDHCLKDLFYRTVLNLALIAQSLLNYSAALKPELHRELKEENSVGKWDELERQGYRGKKARWRRYNKSMICTGMKL